jgi:hypothetical protein
MSTTTLLLLAGGAYLLLSGTGGSLLARLGAGGASGLPAGLPAGTVRLPNGQYRLPTGQVVGTPTAGYAPTAGSSVLPIVTGTLAAIPPLVTFFSRLFSSTAGGTGTGGATGSPGAGGSASVQAPPPTDSSVDSPIASLELSDGSVLDISGFSPGFLGADLSLEAPVLAWGAPEPVEMLFDISAFSVDPSGFSFAETAPEIDPSWEWSFGGYRRARFGALSPAARVGWVPVPMRHG